MQPFHQLAAFKWKAFNLDYKHAKTPAPTPGLIRACPVSFTRWAAMPAGTGWREAVTSLVYDDAMRISRHRPCLRMTNVAELKRGIYSIDIRLAQSVFA